MKRILLLLLTVATMRADDLTKNAQTELKELGFYYGDITGENNTETTAAIRRYQIRNGFEVTGTLGKETLQGLGLGGAAPAPAPPAVAVPPKSQPPGDNDRDFLRKSPPATVAPRTPMATPGTENYAQTFARTPFEIAPAEVQVSTVRKAQNLLTRSGLFRDPIDGTPGPSTEEALLAYQRRQHLPLTGRLDIETLNAMALLPGRSNGPPMKPFMAPRPGSRPLRGVWIN